MKTIFPGATMGLLGGGENSLMLALAAYRMGYRVHVYSPHAGPAARLADVFVQAPYEDLDRVREFASGVAIVTVSGSDVPVLAVRAAAGNAVVFPSARAFETIENGIGATPDVVAGAPALAEFSVIGARGADGAVVFYPPISIDKVDGIMDTARMAAPVRAGVARQAVGLMRDILEDLDFTGVACLGFALTDLTDARELVVHDVIPHPDRAGHLTADACVTSQFEQHLRAICGLPLGSAAMLRPAAMANIPHSAWDDGEPDWPSALALPNVKLCLYGERQGHLSSTATSATLAKQMVRAARNALHPR